MSGIFGKFKKNSGEQNAEAVNGQTENTSPEETASAEQTGAGAPAGTEDLSAESADSPTDKKPSESAASESTGAPAAPAGENAAVEAETSENASGSTDAKEGTEQAENPSAVTDTAGRKSDETASGKADPFEKVSGQEEVIVEGSPVPHSPMDDSPWSGDNPRRNKIVKLEKEARRRNEVEQQRTKWMQREQEYLDRMIDSVEQNMRSTQQQKESNERFQRHIQLEVYRMHGISEDKLQGMEERRAALYQGTAFAMFFLSIVMIILCGALHGFDHSITLFMAFYTAVEASLLTQGRRKHRVLTFLTRILYLVLFPVMLVEFVFYELKLPQYDQVTPVFTILGVVVLILGAIAYFAYDPYTDDRANRKKADKYIKKMGKTAQHDIRAQEKELEKRRKKEENRKKKESAKE